MKIRNAIKDGQASCVFSEPQYNPAMVESLVKGTNVNVVLLDPMAKNLTLKKITMQTFSTHWVKVIPRALQNEHNRQCTKTVKRPNSRECIWYSLLYHQVISIAYAHLNS